MGIVDGKLLTGMGREFWLMLFLSMTCQGDQMLVVEDKRVMGYELCRTPRPLLRPNPLTKQGSCKTGLLRIC